MEAARMAGLVSRQERLPEAQQRELARALTTWARISVRISNDPALRDLTSDPEFSERVRRGELASIMNDPRFAQFARRIFEDIAVTATSHPQPSKP